MHIHVVLRTEWLLRTGRNKIAFAVIVSHKPVAICMIIGVMHMCMYMYFSARFLLLYAILISELTIVCC